jgi:hypothetical protein
MANSTTTTQAPSVNFTTAKMATTTADSEPAERLMANLYRQPGRRLVWWNLAMPKPAMENAVNTPIAYIGTRLLTSASLTISSVTEVIVSTMIALENTSRWPRLSSHRGRKESPAT